jgi:flavorubredoxin
MIENRLRGLKMRVPVAGMRVKLIPTESELESCRQFGHQLGKILTNQQAAKVIDMADLV